MLTYRLKDAYIDISNPPQGLNHVRFRNVKTGVQIQSQESDTSG